MLSPATFYQRSLTPLALVVDRTDFDRANFDFLPALKTKNARLSGGLDEFNGFNGRLDFVG